MYMSAHVVHGVVLDYMAATARVVVNYRVYMPITTTVLQNTCFLVEM